MIQEKNKKIDLDKVLIACGLVGPLIFFLTVYFVFQFFYPGYDMANQTISELGAMNSPVKTLTNVFGFGLFGIFIMLFAFGLFKSKEVNLMGKLSAFFVFVTGILMYLTGIFNGTSGGGYTTLDTIHVIVANYQFPILAFGLVLFAFSVAGNEKLRWLTPVILVLGIVTLYLAYVFFFTIDLQNRGIWQRGAIGIPYVIVMILSWGLYKAQFSK